MGVFIRQDVPVPVRVARTLLKVVSVGVGLNVLTVATPLAIIAALVAVYVVDPVFYSEYVLEPLRREGQAVEVFTFVSLLLAGVLMLFVTRRVWRVRHMPGGWAGLLVVASVNAACLFVAGEEIDWGNTFLNMGAWDTPPDNQGPTTNIHNTSPLPIKSLGSWYLFAVFFVLPGLWALRDRLPMIREGLGHAVPDWPVVFAMAVAFTWRFFKKVYVTVVGRENLGHYGDGGFYWGFVEQINEQKELLIAVALLFYALHRLRATQRPEFAKQAD